MLFLLRICLAGLLYSACAAAVPVYEQQGTTLELGGELQAAYYSKDADYDGALETGDASLYAAGVLAVEIRTALRSGIVGYAHADWDMPDGSGHEHFDLKAMYVGLDLGRYGRLQMGTFEDAFYYSQECVDIFDEFAGLEILDSSEKPGMILYAWSGGGLTLQFSWQTAKADQGVDGAYLPRLGEGAEGERGVLDVEYALAWGAGYAIADVGGRPLQLRVGAGYTDFGAHRDPDSGSYVNALLGTAQQDADVRYADYRQFGATLAWGTAEEGLYAAVHGQRRIFGFKALQGGAVPELQVSGLTLAGGYTWDNGLGLYAGLEEQWADIDGVTVRALVLPLYVLYKYSPHLELWSEARLNLDTDDEPGLDFAALTGHELTSHIISAGMRVVF